MPAVHAARELQHQNRERAQDIIAEAFSAESVDFNLRLAESVLVRIHPVPTPFDVASPSADGWTTAREPWPASHSAPLASQW